MKAGRLLEPGLRALLSLRRRSGPARGLLLVSAGGLGDTVLFRLVLSRFLELAEPGEPVTLLLRKDAGRMGFLFPPGVEILTVDFPKLRETRYRWQMARMLHDRHFRLVVSTDFLRHPHLDEALIKACRAPHALAMEPRSWPKYDRILKANRRLYDRLFDSGGRHCDKVVRWALFADWLTGRVVPPPVVRLAPSELAPAATLPRPLVLIQPFSAVALKQSPVDLYRAIIATLPPDFEVVLAGGPGDLDGNPEYRQLLDLPRVRFDATPFAALVPLLRAARLVISVDTACMHLAAAVGVPTLCLASAAYIGEIVPYAPAITPPNVRFLHTPMECAGCLGACPLPVEDSMYPCVARLDRKAIMVAVGAMLAERRLTED